MSKENSEHSKPVPLDCALGTADDLAFTCECGSVHFNLLKSKYLECAKCGVRYRGLSWFALRKFEPTNNILQFGGWK